MTDDQFTNRNLSEDEDVIAKTINHLRLSDPENAIREYAIGFLKFMERAVYQIEKQHDLNYDDFLLQYKKSQQDIIDLPD